MKKFHIIFAFLLIQNISGVFAQKLSIDNVKQKSNTLEIEITFKNSSSKDVVIVSPNPNKKYETSYFLIPEDKAKMLQIRRYFFSYPPYVLDVNEPCFSLTKIKAGESYRETLSLEYPMAQTHFFTKTKFDLRSFDSISFNIGVLPVDSFINKILDSRPFGHCAEGYDEIYDGLYKGKTLIEIQNILKTNTVKIN